MPEKRREFQEVLSLCHHWLPGDWPFSGCSQLHSPLLDEGHGEVMAFPPPGGPQREAASQLHGAPPGLRQEPAVRLAVVGGEGSTSAEGCRSIPALTSAACSAPAVFGPDQPRVGDNESSFLLLDLGASLASDASPPSTLNHLLWWDSDRGTFHDFYLSFVQFISAYHTPETPVTSFSPPVYGRLG